MEITQLISFEPGKEFTIANLPFSYTGKAELLLEGGDKRHWLFDHDRSMLTVAPEAEELMFFQSIEDELEPEDGMILFHGEEYEENYQDAGRVTRVVGELVAEEEDFLSFVDYQNDSGKVIRLIVNENTGESQAYSGRVIVEDDIQTD